MERVVTQEVIEAQKFVELTRREVKEEERLKEIIALFKGVFGFAPKPEQIHWNAENKLEASVRVELEEEKIMGKPIAFVLFSLIEDENADDELHWRFVQSTEPMYFCYTWIKKFRGYKAIVEIRTRRYIGCR